MNKLELQGTTLLVLSEDAMVAMVDRAVSRAIAAYQHAIEGKESEAYLTTDEAAALLRVTRNSLWRWAKDGYLVPAKVGQRSLYRRADVEALMRGNNSVAMNNNHGNKKGV